MVGLDTATAAPTFDRLASTFAQFAEALRTYVAAFFAGVEKGFENFADQRQRECEVHALGRDLRKARPELPASV